VSKFGKDEENITCFWKIYLGGCGNFFLEIGDQVDIFGKYYEASLN
jgi:hypothetical protein